MATKDGRAQIWYTDVNGNVTGYTETVDNIAGTIIDAYNDHFGTDIQIWTPETITLQVGGTVPNWNAYEKIEISSQKIAVNIQRGSAAVGLICGELSDKIFTILTNGSNALVANIEGSVLAYAGPPSSAESTILSYLSDYNLEATKVVEDIVDYQPGSVVPQWDEYEQFI